jgi:hypothetical protein
MSDSPNPSTPPIPVICDKCRASGMAGDEAFAAVPDLLNFDPVPRRPHANGWTPEHQRAFVAALAISGSMRQAARYVGRAAYGAEQLRTAKGGRSFDAACEAAMELARDREIARLHDNLGELKAKTDAELAQAKAEGRLVAGRDEFGDGDDGNQSYEEEMEGVRKRLFDKLQMLRKRTLLDHIDDPEWCKAYDLINGPQDWEGLKNGSWKPATWRGAKEPPSSSFSPESGDPPNSPLPVAGEGQGEGPLPISPTSQDGRGPRVRRM